MSIDSKHGRYCDECGRTIKKAHRVFENNDYCATCYPRVFVSKPCTHCGESARVHRLSGEPPVCRACVRIGRVCIRCEKPIIKAGMISAGTPVCPACVPHFKTATPCAACGELSTRLAAMPSAGIAEKVCESCRNRVTHKTCSVCRKYRKVAGISADEKPYCQACAPGAPMMHSCPGCGIEVPGNGASKCRACVNRALLLKEVSLNELMLSREWVRTLYRAFAQWLFDRQTGSPNLMKVFKSHQIFFERIDAQFFSLTEVTAENILQTFGTSALRKHLLATQFLTDTLSLEITPEDKAKNADAERIRNKLLENRKYSWGRTLEQFAAQLEEASVPTRTRRLYLATAEAFCGFVRLDNQPWSDDDIRRFLKQKPGLRANLFKFIGHCRSCYGWDVRMPERAGAGKIKALPKTVLDLQKLLRKIESDSLDKADQGTLARIIAKSLGFPVRVVLNFSVAQFHVESNNVVLSVNEEIITIPAQLQDVARAYMERLH